MKLQTPPHREWIEDAKGNRKGGRKAAFSGVSDR
jgi:hypothetical protein